MEDIGLAPKATNDPVHRPTVTETFGMHQEEHAPLRHIHISDTNRKFDLEKDGPSRKKPNSVIAEPLMIPMCPPHNPVPVPSVIAGGMNQEAHHNAADKNGNTAIKKSGSAKKKSKARVAEPSSWKQNKQKQLRMEGKSYVSKRKKDGEAVTKKPRTIGPRCTSSACKRASNRFCNDISDETRKRLFDEFWQHMNWTQRRVYVAGLVDRDPVERNRGAAGAQSRRTVSLRYHLRVDGKRKQVCKNTFLSTLGVGEWSVLSWAQKTVARKNESNEKVAEKRPAVPQCPEPNPPPPTATNTAEVNQDVNQEEHSDSDTEQQSTELDIEGLARKKSRVAKPQTWKQNKQKQLRMEGKPYISRRKKDGTTVTKEPRKMGPGCKSNACKRASNRFCADISENTRKQLFDGFWQRMTWTQRKLYVAGLVDRDPVERTRAPWTQSRRTVSLRYHLIVDGDRKQVCKRMFLSTLGVGEWSVLNWAQNAAAQQADSDGTNAKKRPPRKSAKASEHLILKEYLENLPKVPSYYCGTSISKLFLEPVFSNMTEVYRQYKTHCSEKQTAPLSRQVFCAVFKKMDLGLCDPKKDQGCSYNTPATGNLFNELWEEYCMEREHPAARPEKLGES